MRQFSIADITLSWPRLNLPPLRSRNAAPWARKISATSTGVRPTLYSSATPDARATKGQRSIRAILYPPAVPAPPKLPRSGFVRRHIADVKISLAPALGNINPDGNWRACEARFAAVKVRYRGIRHSLGAHREGPYWAHITDE